MMVWMSDRKPPEAARRGAGAGFGGSFFAGGSSPLHCSGSGSGSGTAGLGAGGGAAGLLMAISGDDLGVSGLLSGSGPGAGTAAGFLNMITAAHFRHWIFSGIGSGMLKGA